MANGQKTTTTKLPGFIQSTKVAFARPVKIPCSIDEFS